ncbi:40S RIBOSOMAL PROTEIN S17 [Salix viminalis]|uniref:40S RIBOSOMAL PROTEIN S17 n=1 Tax=Salix viminalis TaxID=40686 RepID=A0A9Q0TYF9_SALVM|nr:40S RIBOSOMAL PROTEIN S17 [Salix viminalis]
MGRVRTKTVKKSSRQIHEIKVDKETIDMLAALGMSDVPGLVEVEPQPMIPTQGFGRGGGGGARRFLS